MGVPFQFPKFGIPVPRNEKLGSQFSITVPEIRECNFPFPFPFSNVQKSFPFTPVSCHIMGLRWRPPPVQWMAITRPPGFRHFHRHLPNNAVAKRLVCLFMVQTWGHIWCRKTLQLDRILTRCRSGHNQTLAST